MNPTRTIGLREQPPIRSLSSLLAVVLIIGGLRAANPQFTNPLVEQRADPWIHLYEDGYHARSYGRIEGEALRDPNRHTRAQLLRWHSDGTPDFGVPVLDGPLEGQPIR